MHVMDLFRHVVPTRANHETAITQDERKHANLFFCWKYLYININNNDHIHSYLTVIHKILIIYIMLKYKWTTVALVRLLTFLLKVWCFYQRIKRLCCGMPGKLSQFALVYYTSLFPCTWPRLYRSHHSLPGPTSLVMSKVLWKWTYLCEPGLWTYFTVFANSMRTAS